ncbi:winged helix DNA-binding domain-containing protein [Yinghuangia sp. ASG 101]|uniref:winged helix DNA-binding domain-containing protein n=1 Tax=Yinghuangia sp. ASG 101 TaxID=2896848 RepID=UPI001E5385DC|nr:winged helix DNA-binding domain-containing protein [Yinghuangia sp. ASG 101]UGQ14084.1 winged helix DNA-binding domain-containing protein [Yinghuangia sp. ASG 101]
MTNHRVLGHRELNRALLARQHLLSRVRMPALDMVRHLAGLQAQHPTSSYFTLWARLADFDPQELAGLMTDRKVLRIALMRSTIHTVTADDSLAWRPLLLPVMERMFTTSHLRATADADRDELTALGRAFIEEKPRTFAEVGAYLGERWPDAQPTALAAALRTWAPLVQVPPRGLWGRSGPVAHTTAEHWLGRPLDTAPAVDDMVLRCLAALGPMTAKDVQVWSGLTRLAPVLEGLRPRLVAFRDERGRELFDLPDAPRPDPETPAPVRFIADFDNITLSHDDRTRVISRAWQKWRLGQGSKLWGSVLVDGFVRGAWRVERTKDTATLLVASGPEPTGAIASHRDELEAEGGRLLGFAAQDRDKHDIAFA